MVKNQSIHGMYTLVLLHINFRFFVNSWGKTKSQFPGAFRHFGIQNGKVSICIDLRLWYTPIDIVEPINKAQN